MTFGRTVAANAVCLSDHSRIETTHPVVISFRNLRRPRTACKSSTPGQIGTCTCTFCDTILQTCMGTLFVTFTGTQTVYFCICFRGTVRHTVSEYVSVF